MKNYLLGSLFILLCSPVFSQNNWNDSITDKDKIESELKIYPNPCKNSKVTVDFNSKEISEISLTNITGKQVLLKRYEFFTHKIQLQLNDIPNGLYLIQVKTSDNKTLVKKLMISKN